MLDSLPTQAEVSSARARLGKYFPADITDEACTYAANFIPNASEFFFWLKSFLKVQDPKFTDAELQSICDDFLTIAKGIRYGC